MKCYVLSTDLMFSSQAIGAAQNAHVDAESIQSATQIASSDRAIVVLDLASPQLNIDSTIKQLVNLGMHIVAVGPHVQREKLKLAEAAGATRVITKGQAHHELGEILLSLLN